MRYFSLKTSLMYPMFRAGVGRVQHPAAAQHHAGQGGAGRGQEPPRHRGH